MAVREMTCKGSPTGEPYPDAPALSFLLRREDWGEYGPNGMCVYFGHHCPFSSADSREEREGGRVDNDPSEAYYDCSMLGKTVWGENPECADADWRQAARVELVQMGVSAAEPADTHDWSDWFEATGQAFAPGQEIRECRRCKGREFRWAKVVQFS